MACIIAVRVVWLTYLDRNYDQVLAVVILFSGGESFHGLFGTIPYRSESESQVVHFLLRFRSADLAVN